jgi:hypothetical protein
MDPKTLNQWIAVEHSRLHGVEYWPDSLRKQTVLAAIHSSIRSLMTGDNAAQFDCSGVNESAAVIPFRSRFGSIGELGRRAG